MYVNPYSGFHDPGATWYKGNFHVHASPDGGGGRFPVTDVVKMYREANYQVLTVSMQRTFVDITEIGKGLDMLTVSGIEYVEHDGILLVGIDHFLRGEPQAVIDECTGGGGFAVICHPNWLSEKGLPRALTKREMRELRGYVGMEVLTPAIFNRFKGSGLATDVWDEFLSAGKLVWGFANDDFHTLFEFDRGWNMICADALDYASLKSAVTRGSLYASSGLSLHQFAFDNEILEVEANFARTPARNIRYEVIGEGGRLLKSEVGRKVKYRLSGDEAYVRVQASSESGAMLWTQPVYDDARLRAA
jgi:hypothetical protein